MKHIIFLYLSILVCLPSFSQIIQEKNFPLHSTFQVVEIENEGAKYLAANIYDKSVTLYNPDYTVYKKMQVPVWDTILNLHPSYASKGLFDTNTDIEVLISATLKNSLGIYYRLFVLKENGAIYYEFPNAHTGQIKNVNGNFKLIVNDILQTPNGVKIYSLVGKYIGIKKVTSSGGNVNIYPNPVISSSKISYQLPDNDRTGVVSIYDTKGSLIRSYNIQQSGNIHINNMQYPAGLYIYSLLSDNYSYQGSFVVQ